MTVVIAKNLLLRAHSCALQADEEREHARKIMSYINERGGVVQVGQLPKPEYDLTQQPEKGDAQHAMELALAMEHINFQKLTELDQMAAELGDFALGEFIENMLSSQSRDVKKAADKVANLVRVGKGHGTWAWDRDLLHSSTTSSSSS